MEDLIYVRVLQHDTTDQIRISMAYPLRDENAIPEHAEKVREQYDKECEWCGGFDAACGKYYKRIAIVEASTLAVLHTIYEDKVKQEDKEG